MTALSDIPTVQPIYAGPQVVTASEEKDPTGPVAITSDTSVATPDEIAAMLVADKPLRVKRFALSPQPDHAPADRKSH